MKRGTILLGAMLTATGALASGHDICIENATDAPWLFTAAADDGARRSARLEPGASLCVEGRGTGTVAVFEDGDALEGCSRRTTSGRVQRLTRFPGVDLCDWQTD